MSDQSTEALPPEKVCGRCWHWRMYVTDDGGNLRDPEGNCTISGEDCNGNDSCAFFEPRGLHRAHMTLADIAREQTRH
jgi:hypothetical protein